MIVFDPFNFFKRVLFLFALLTLFGHLNNYMTCARNQLSFLAGRPDVIAL